jgi:RNA 3'-terminal phosphate cyclase
MDWVALKPQEPPRPVMPHELRLDSGAVQVEIQRMVKQGGGHVVMELTPPDQSKFTIELKLDDNGGAYLKVEGVSDSTKTRLEQSAPQLQEQFQQMGLNLQLDMRQNRDSSSSGSANWMPNEPGFDNNLPQEATAQTNRAVAAERAHNQNGGQVFLYA